MCVGLVDESDLVRSTAGEAGNALILVGADTGRDGIHGASGLASRTFEEERELRPAVQVGNPFLEKVLIEACLELAATEHVVGMQDLGAAGLSSACVEAADKAGAGFDIDVSRVPRRDAGMTPYEVMLSESQERMLVVARPGHEDAVREMLAKWDLSAVVLGRVTSGGRARVYDGGSLEGDVPVGLLADAPQYRPPAHKPQWLDDLQSRDLDALPLPEGGPNDVLLKLLDAPNVASKESVFRQYDHHVQTNTVVGPGADAAVLRVKGSAKGIALTVDGNGRYCYLDPYEGGKIAVAEACRNLSAVGAEPVALTDCLNFGNPERPEIYHQLQECVRGMAEASRAFDAPVISGNVSLYNESEGQGVYPTPVVGALGLLEDAAIHCTTAFRDEGDAVLLLGAGDGRVGHVCPCGQRVPRARARAGGRAPIHPPRGRTGCSAFVPPGDPVRPAEVGARLLRRRTGRGARRVLHRGSRGLPRERGDIRAMGRGPLRRAAVAHRRIAGARGRGRVRGHLPRRRRALDAAGHGRRDTADRRRAARPAGGVDRLGLARRHRQRDQQARGLASVHGPGSTRRATKPSPRTAGGKLTPPRPDAKLTGKLANVMRGCQLAAYPGGPFAAIRLPLPELPE